MSNTSLGFYVLASRVASFSKIPRSVHRIQREEIEARDAIIIVRVCAGVLAFEALTLSAHSRKVDFDSVNGQAPSHMDSKVRWIISRCISMAFVSFQSVVQCWYRLIV